MTCIGQVEIDPFCRRVLAKHWPDVPRMADVREVRGDEFGPVDLVCGGFPCQDVSSVGCRRGINGGKRSGLWAEYARIIRAVRPSIVVVENVAGLLERDIGRVLGDLAACGLDAEWDSFPAGALGAPHLRWRVFVVAYPQGDARAGAIFPRAKRMLPHLLKRESGRGFGPHVPGSYWEAPQPGLIEVDDGVPDWSHEVSAYGSAVVPQVAEVIARAILEART